jgi:hypothetical protein
MKDEIFWGNLLGLLKRGRWNLGLEESQALVAIFMEAERRSRPPVLAPQEVKPPIKKDKEKSKDANK